MGRKDSIPLFLVTLWTVFCCPFSHFLLASQWLWPGVFPLNHTHPDCNPLSPLTFSLISECSRDALTVSFLMMVIWGQEDPRYLYHPRFHHSSVSWAWTVEHELSRMRVWTPLYIPTSISQVSL